MGSGEFADREIARCVHQLFTFPIDRMHTRLDLALQELGLKQSDVYSVEERAWFYTWPLYSNQCTVISLNTQGASKIKNADTVYTEQSTAENRDEDASAVAGADEFGNINSLEKCNEMRPLHKARCRESVISRKKKSATETSK